METDDIDEQLARFREHEGDSIVGQNDIDASVDRHGAQVIQIDTGRHLAVMVICSIISGICLSFAIVCAAIAWNTSTDTQIIRNRLVSLQAQHDELVSRVSRNEGESHAIR